MRLLSPYFKCLCSLILVCFTALTYGQQRDTPYTIHMREGFLLPGANAQQWLDSMKTAHYTGTMQVFVQCYEIPDQHTRGKLQQAGVRLTDYIPDKTYIAVMDLPLRQALPTGVVCSIIPVQPSWKTDKRIREEYNLQTAKKAAFFVSFSKLASFADIAAIVTSFNAAIKNRKYASANMYEVEIAQNRLMALAAYPLVNYIGVPPSIVPLNNDARAASAAAFLYAPVIAGGYALDGAGVTLGVGDNTSAVIHVDARDRVTNFNPAGPTMHGVHTTLTTAGKGIMDPKAKGLAPSAMILNHLYELVWSETPSMYAGYNMTVTNNSYASVANDCNYAGLYDQAAQALDDYAVQFPEVQNVFAAGNDGLNTCNGFPPGYGTVNGGFQPAKNIIDVGGIYKSNTAWPKTSRGPVRDGRLKPDIVAFGHGVYSGDIFDMYGLSNGTSMAAPIVTGSLGLLTQRYKQLHGNANPASDLLKAITVNGAVDIGNPGPDFIYGFGMLDLYRSIQILNNSWYFVDSVDNNATKTHTINVPANTAQLKVMLYWNDAPATPLAATALINDLDLQVKEPSNTTHLPLILDPSTAGVANNAAEGVDELNNTEQVVINNPQTGSYTISVKGTTIPANKQHYVITYDLVPTGVFMKFPTAAIPVAGDDSIRIYWDASDNANTFTLEFSDNNGASWMVISNSIPSDQRYFFWKVPDVTTDQALMRITRNNTGQQFTTGKFVVNPQPVVQLDAVQCPGYIRINWNAIAGVSGYEVLKKTGDQLSPVDTVTGTDYTFSGLSMDSTYYVGVRPMVNGVRGYRSKSLRRQPDDGTCAGNISDGDLGITRVLAPHSGRVQTSLELSNSETLAIRVHNFDDAAASNYRVSYSINGGTWNSQNGATAIVPNGDMDISFPGVDFSSAGDYHILAAVENIAINDPVHANDTIAILIRQLSNDPVDLNAGYMENFDAYPKLTVTQDSMGVLPGDHWDFTHTTDSGRLRTFVGDEMLISGQRSLSLDLFYARPDNQNYFTGTFNLAAYNTANVEARMEFDYKIHGQPKFEDGNDVYVRGDDTQPWVKLYTIDTTVIEGQITNTGSLSLSDALINSGQNFSSSLQVRIGQRDTSVIAANYYGNGMTIDNFRLYSVKNDMQLLKIMSPQNIVCAATVNTPLTVSVYNSDNLPQQNVQLYYQLDNGSIVNETLPAIAAKDTIDYTFTQTMNLSQPGDHMLHAWLVATGDTYLPNDSVLNYALRNQPLIAAFPYLENFEMNDGYWFSRGQNSSWEYGTPSGISIHTAASGNKIWTTGLNTNYNNNEQSYLYSPCFDISSLADPMLSFSLVTDIENCGDDICDAAYVEYSEDGIVWTKLGASGEGTNWYGNKEVWNDENATRWRVASIPLPHITSLKLRFVFHSDVGAQRDGVGVDDIHIFDLLHQIYDGATVNTSQTVHATGWTDMLSGNKLIAQIDALGQDLGTTTVSVYPHTNVYSEALKYYYIPRNIVINCQQQTGDAATRLFITDEEVLRMLQDNSCDTCTKAADAYRLGIVKYDSDPAHENGSLLDNKEGSYSFFPYQDIQWVPYDNGYYAQAAFSSFSEIWFANAVPVPNADNVRLFPNPVTDGTLYLIWTATPGDKMQFTLTDAAGKLVFKQETIANDYDNKTVFNLPQLGTGMYFARYTNGRETQTVKIIAR